MLMDRKAQYCQDVSSFQYDLQIQCSSNKRPSKFKKKRERGKITDKTLLILKIENVLKCHKTVLRTMCRVVIIT